MAKNITGIVTWLKGWFFDKDEITAKEQALQTQINNKASVTDLNTTNGNVSSLQSAMDNKVDKVTGKGLSTNDYTAAEKAKLEGIEAQANKYVHPTGVGTAQPSAVFKKIKYDANGHITGTENVIGTDLPEHNHNTAQVIQGTSLSNLGTGANASQNDVNVAINNTIGDLKNLDLIVVTDNKGTASASTMNKLYVVSENNEVNYYYTKRNGTSPNYTYVWEQFDANIVVDTDWTNIQNKPSTFTPATHNHNDLYYTETEIDEMKCGNFTELLQVINSANGGTVILDKNYKFDSSTDSGLYFIRLSDGMTIIGNGHIIDANNQTKIFSTSGGQSVTIKNVIFTNATDHQNATSGGSAIEFGYGSLTLIDCVFVGNNFTNVIGRGGYGGAVSIRNGNAYPPSTFRNCVFLNNSSADNGGAIGKSSSGTLNIYDCVFKGNTATNNGNDIYANNEGTVNVCNCDTSNANLYNATNKPYLTEHQNLSGCLQSGDAITSIVTVPKSEDATGALRLYFGDEPNS